jgi:hypothetical protein
MIKVEAIHCDPLDPDFFEERLFPFQVFTNETIRFSLVKKVFCLIFWGKLVFWPPLLLGAGSRDQNPEANDGHDGLHVDPPYLFGPCNLVEYLTVELYCSH